MRILIIGSLEGQIGAASQIAIKKGASVLHAPGTEEGLDIQRSGGADLILMDVKLDIADLVARLETEKMNVPVVACGIATDAQAAVRAIKAGAKEYIPLPPDAELIGAVLAAVSGEGKEFIYADPLMDKLVKMAAQVAPSSANIFITGESGTGKEVIAQYIHGKSKRASGRFVAVNCAAIPENLMESELFGYEKGAFTGAVARRIGKFEEANGGTLLLDEISEMDIRLQAKLLRAIQEKKIDRIGGKTPIPVDVRILATSNRNLKEEIDAKRFREDLYFRLNVVSISIPALRDRRSDIPPLSDYFIKKYCAMNGMQMKTLTDRAKKAMLGYSFPGNVRELENMMHSAVVLSGSDQIDTDVLQMAPSSSSGTAASGAGLVGRTVADVERDLIIDTLKHTLGNRTHAANILGISIRTLRNKLKQYNDEGRAIPPPPSGEGT